MKRNPFNEGKNYVIFYRNEFHKVWATFDYLESVNECKEVLKRASYFKVWKKLDTGKYVVFTTKKRLSDKIVRELSKKIASSSYRDQLVASIKKFRQKIQDDLEKKNAL